MVDPFALTVATNVATRLADSLTDQAQRAVAAIVRRIGEKLRSQPGQPGEVAALDAAIAASDAPTAQTQAQALALVLERLFAADPGFRDEIRALWDSAGIDDSVTNIFHGKADKVIMMRDVHGDLTIN